MRPNYDIIIGIDPDVDKSGVAVLSTNLRKVYVNALSFPDLLESLKDHTTLYRKTFRTFVVVVEASWMIRGNWHLTERGRKQYAAATGYKVGCNHQVGKLIVEMCKAYNIPVIEHCPLRKCWSGKDGKITHEELIQFCPIDKTRTNQEMRDAALLAWSFADFPIRLKALPKR
ncbi:MAG: hypothetical protein NC110_00135 [Ruminococcus sp.]|nr:hypothetical protein [Ruminococcus sp.]